MLPSPFKLEEYLTTYEFNSPHLLCCSDAESFKLQDILDLATPHERCLWNELRLSYTEPYGMPSLRDQIAQSFYAPLTSENILCFAGAEEGIFASLHVLCEPEDHIIVITPCYQSLLEIPLLKKATVTTIPLRVTNNWCLDLKEIEKSIRPNTKCLIINFPHNPTGQVITPKEISTLVALCDKYGLWLFADEVYRLLGTPAQGWAEPAACLYPKALSLGVMSKAFGMAGLRIGWIACQDKTLLHKIKKMKDYLSICNSAPSEIISFIALKNKEKILKRNNRIVSDNLNLLDSFFDEYQQLFEWIRPQGGCVGFVRYKGSEAIDIFCQRLINEKGVLLMPGSVYDWPNSYFRIGFGRETMPAALDKFKEFLES